MTSDTTIALILLGIAALGFGLFIYKHPTNWRSYF